MYTAFDIRDEVHKKVRDFKDYRCSGVKICIN